jgi:hypothetical protein
MPELKQAQCARCGGTRITYKNAEGDRFIVVPFAIDAEAPLDDQSIQKFAVTYAAKLTEALMEFRMQRSNGLVIVDQFDGK